MARRQTARPAPAWTGDLPVFERRLSNGFRALVLPRRNASVAVCDLYYPVGSVDEPPGRTGLAHFVEHMLFKGTSLFPKGHIDRLAYFAAGHANAETGDDLTHYWFALPTERWELALTVEADRMLGARFDPAEVEAERHVIAEERARDLDSPVGRLDQTHLAMSYLIHPYRNPILGWPEDLRRTTAEELRNFHALHYRPDGAVLVVVGNLHPERALDRIEAHFGDLAAGEQMRPARPAAEPRQSGRREFQLVDSEAIARGLLGWHTIPRGRPDCPALDVLSDILCCGRRSRLWDRLVERGRLATWVESNHDSAQLAGQFLIQVEAAPGVEPGRIETEIQFEIARLAEEGPTESELSRSRHRLEAAWRWEQEDASGLAGGLGHVALWGDWRNWQAEHRAALAVSADEIRRVASTYLGENGLTVGWSLPRPPELIVSLPEMGRPTVAPRPSSPPAPEGPLAVEIPGGVPSLVDYRPRRWMLPNGLRVLTERRPGTGTVALELHVDAGLLRESKPGLAQLTARLREEGTSTRSAEALSAAIEDVGGTLDVSSTGVSVRVRSEDLDLALELLADVMLRPAFPLAKLEWSKRKMAAELEGDRDDPTFLAELVFRSLIYGAHPYARDPRGTASSIRSLTLEDVRGHHDRLVSPGNAFLVAVGDFDVRVLRGLIRHHLRGWDGPTTPSDSRRLPAKELDPLIAPVRSRTRRVFHPGEQIHLLLGHLGVRRSHPDFDALCVLDYILGTGPGFTDRLSRVLRDELGLAYAVGGGITDSADNSPGMFRVYVGTGPNEIDRAVAAVREQVRAIHSGEFSSDEVARARSYLADSWVFDFQSVGQRAERLLEIEYFGLPLDEPLQWPHRIARISPRQVRLAASRHLKPDALVHVEYGPIVRRQNSKVNP
jgi:zinc protease